MQQLLNPFAQKYPESNEGSFPSEAAAIKLNPSGPYAGHYLAAGNFDGTVHVWDVETRGTVRTLRGHSKTVGGLCWSRNNRYLLTASLDSTCIIWDLSTLPQRSLRPTIPLPSGIASTSDSRVATIRLHGPVAKAEFHPRSTQIVLATLTGHEVVLIDRRPGGGKAVLQDVMEVDVDENGDEVDQDEGAQKRGSICCALFSPCGSRIYAGTTKGRILIIDPVSRFVIQRVQVATSAIRQMSFDASGRYVLRLPPADDRNLLTAATDRALRLLSVSPLSGTLTPSHRFQDQVNRTPWHSLGFNPDSEYVMGGAGHKAAHNIFVWDRESGVLVKVLEGPKESLGDCEWHPTRPIIISTTTSGDIQVWQTSTPDNWAAFAPGFEELEENVEYDEQEDEFDIEDETELTRRKDLEEDTDIDILRMDDSYPRRPDPLLALPPGMASAAVASADEESVTETVEARAVRLAAAVVKWVGSEDDGDSWEGFYISLDLVTPDPDLELQIDYE